MKYIYLTTIAICVLFSGVFSQQSVHPGIELYQAGKYREAIVALNEAVKDSQYQKSGEIWNYLGLSYLGANDLKNARESLEKAVKLDQGNSTYRGNLAYLYLLQRDLQKARSEADKTLKLDAKNVRALVVRGTANYLSNRYDDALRDVDRAISLDDKWPEPYIIKSKILVSRMSQRVLRGSSIRKELALLRQATETLKAGREKCTLTTKCKEIAEEYEAMSIFLDYFSKSKPEDSHISGSVPTSPEPGTTPVKIISKPRPEYTPEAQSAGLAGTIQLAVMFGANGKIEHVLLLSRLGGGLDEKAVEAARGIKFEPATKDGKPISVVKRVEYTFSVY